jgi:hypothetical protein
LTADSTAAPSAGATGSPFTPQDAARMRGDGISEEKALAQLEIFRKGPAHTRLERACAVNDGIARLSRAELETLGTLFAEEAARGRALQFTPASGAATRMFKGLLAAHARGEADKAHFALFAREAGQGQADAKEFLDFYMGLSLFPFRDALQDSLSRAGLDLEALYDAKDYLPILEHLLTAKGLGYADRPKALIAFHRYGSEARTALEEHLVEAAALVRDAKGTTRLHFTVSAEHEKAVLTQLEKVRPRFEAAGARFDIGFSQQKPSTNTLAADQDNRPFRNSDGTLAFRPGGHGALLENLHHTGGDIVFIKNIDNLVTDRYRGEVLLYRKALGGYLVRLQERIFGYLRRLRAEGSAAPDAALLDEAAQFTEQRLGTLLPDALRAAGARGDVLVEKRAFLIKTLNRPLRVCAMVKNQGEPGGGPFWVRYPDGALRLQIVETAQIDTGNSQQRKILESSSHFNPTDLVCGLRDCEGRLFQLQDYVDPEAYFISVKSKDGKSLKALELPGLWNGSMAFWNTAFIEAPVEIFNPVKTVTDLLRPRHQS